MSKNVNKFLYVPEEIFPLAQENKVTLIDVRDQDFYHEQHIEGAVNVPDIFYFLTKSSDEGLNELKVTFETHFSNAGVSHDKLLLFYEDSLTKRYCGSCRGYWLSQYLGHPNAGILLGGLDAWIEQGFPVSTEVPEVTPTHFKSQINPSFMATKADVLKAIDDPNVILLDDRDREEWVADSSSPYGKDFVPRKGRIPGAVWIEWRKFMDTQGEYPAFKSIEQIIELCAAEGIQLENDIIIYCFKGSRASNTYVALTLAGFKNLRVYFASWNEWAQDPNLPIDESPIQDGIDNLDPLK